MPDKARARRLAVLDVLSSVRLGVALLVALFFYCWLGSAGLFYPVLAEGGIAWRHQMVRQWRMFELTEFEWFHTWFFVGLCAAICLIMAVTTIRRIPFNALKAGVWMIHGGVILLAVGSVIYFGTKVEGDAPVLRRQVVARLPSGASAALPALEGAEATLDGPEGAYQLQVVSVQPNYELRTPGFEGTTDYAVQVMVRRAGGQADAPEAFVRQVLSRHPQFTEDVIPGQGRVKNIAAFGGETMLDDPIGIALESAPQDSFWVKDSWALHVRTRGAQTWSQRCIPSGAGWMGRGLPRYNDYFGAADDVWPPAGATRIAVDPLDLPVAGQGDALDGIDVRITGYLRYAVMQSRRVPSFDPSGSPMVDAVLTLPDGEQFRYQLAALAPGEDRQLDGRLAFAWLERQGDLELWRARLSPGELTFLVLSEDGSGPYQESAPVTSAAAVDGAAPFKTLGNTGFAWRLRQVTDDLEVRPGVVASFAIIEIRTPEGEVLLRAASADPDMTADIDAEAHDAGSGMGKPDPRIITLYRPGAREEIVFAGGPGAGVSDDAPVRLLRRSAGGALLEQAMRVGDGIEISPGVMLRLGRYVAHSALEERPTIVEPERRDKDALTTHTYAMIRVRLTPEGGEAMEHWLPYHQYVFNDGLYEGAGLSRFAPTLVVLPDGGAIELAFGRERRSLPMPVELRDFVLTSHIGGFTGSVSSVRDWTSVLRPVGAGEDGLVRVSVNAPKNVGGVWLFQSFWDAPRGARGSMEPGNPGFGFTGLGVGTRRGVVTALLGAILTCAGMLYTFYVKPIIRRRLRAAVDRQIADGTLTSRRDRGEART